MGPAAQPNTNFVAVSSPGIGAPGVITEIDASGDSVIAQATTGIGAFSFSLGSTGSSGYNLNSNDNGSVTLNSYTVAAGGLLQTKNVLTSTLAQGANPVNILNTPTTLYLIEPYVNLATGAVTGQPSVATLSATTTPPALQQEIPVAPNPVNFAGSPGTPRIYAFGQSSTGSPTLNYNACNTPGTVTQTGEAAAIETATNAVSQRLPLGICSVFGIMSIDHNRTFVLNRGGTTPGDFQRGVGTITVINSQLNQIDTAHPSIAVGTGPVHADLYTPGQLLVTANYDDNSISIVNIGLDVYGNDGPNFGQLIATVKVGSGPVAVTILQDGTKAYVANQNDGTVSVVDLSSYTVVKTIPVYQNSQTGAGAVAHPKAIASVSSTPAGKVYVVSSDSQYVTVIRTDTDDVSASVLLQGFGVDVRSSAQVASGPSNASTVANTIVTSRIGGLGTPCGVNDQSPFCTSLH